MNKHINHQYWLRIAQAVAKASTCKADVGCVLVHKKMIVGIGYVGSVHGDAHCDGPNGHINVPAEYRGENGETCIRTIHAEVNAILKCTVRGSKEHGIICYSTHQPCCECLKLLLQIGVHDILYITGYEDARRDLYIQRAIVRGWWHQIHMMQVHMDVQ